MEPGWTVAALLLVIWIAGLVLDFGGSLLHLFLLSALLLAAFSLTSGRRGPAGVRGPGCARRERGRVSEEGEV